MTSAPLRPVTPGVVSRRPRPSDPPVDRLRSRVAAAVRRSPFGASRAGRAVAADPRWLLPIALVAYILYVTWTWEFPNWQGIPFPPVWIGSTLAALAVWRRAGRRLAPIEVTAMVVLSAMVLTDVTLFWTQGMRDLELYLKAGDRWLAGQPVYMTTPLAVRPEDLSDYPFLYPPLTLPLVGLLAALPTPVAAAVWIGGSMAAVLAAFRWIGLDWRWSLVFLAWPPTAQGLYVGNVAVPMFALFAAAIWRPALLVLPPIFKLHSGIAALWLLRPRQWRALAVGMAVAALVVVLTLPVTGAELWVRWIAGLDAYQVSQRLLPDFLYGFGLGRYLPFVAVAGLAVVVTVVALRARARREQLSRLGVATVVGSPSLYSHGWLVALPAALRLDTPWFWLFLGLTACSPGLAWFFALGVVLASWRWPGLRRRRAFDPWHPLGASTVPWPVRGTARDAEAPSSEACPPAAPAPIDARS